LVRVSGCEVGEGFDEEELVFLWIDAAEAAECGGVLGPTEDAAAGGAVAVGEGFRGDAVREVVDAVVGDGFAGFFVFGEADAEDGIGVFQEVA
jgi:hypothetical protein